MLNWIIVAGCAGGIAGFVFGVVVERVRLFLRDDRRRLQAETIRAAILDQEVAVTSSRPPPMHAAPVAYRNGAAWMHHRVP